MKQVLTHSAQLGQMLSSRRRAAKLSQRALAVKLAISQNRLSEIEIGPGNLTVERLLALVVNGGENPTKSGDEKRRSAWL